jgi:hypothetical protein
MLWNGILPVPPSELLVSEALVEDRPCITN